MHLDLAGFSVEDLARISEEVSRICGGQLAVAASDRRDERAIDLQTVAVAASVISATCGVIGIALQILRSRKVRPRREDVQPLMRQAFSQIEVSLHSAVRQRVREYCELASVDEDGEIHVIVKEARYEVKAYYGEQLYIKGRQVEIL